MLVVLYNKRRVIATGSRSRREMSLLRCYIVVASNLSTNMAMPIMKMMGKNR